MRLLLALVACLLVLGGIAAYFYFDNLVVLSLAGVSLAARRVLIRAALVFLVFPFMPEKWRHGIEHRLAHIGEWKDALIVDVRELWEVGSWPIRIVLIFGSALVAGACAGLLIFSPGNIRRIPFVGPWLSERVMPTLLRTATAKSVEAHIPPLWKKIPARLRSLVRRPFVRLWWRTARYGVRTRQIVGRHHKNGRS